MGFDLGSEPARLAALRRAAETGQPAATGRITLVQETGSQYGVLIVAPVYNAGIVPATPAERRIKLIGFATGVIRIGDSIQAALKGSHENGLLLQLQDASAPLEQQLLYSQLPHDTMARPAMNDVSGALATSRFVRAKQMEFGGRQWTLTAIPAPGNFAPDHGWKQWWPSAGLFFTTLLTIAYLENIRRQKLVVLRGRALKSALHKIKVSKGLLASALAEKAQILESMGENLYQIDSEGKCTFANARACKMLGYELSEMLGRNMHDLIHHHYGDGRHYPVRACLIFKALQTGEPSEIDDEVLWKKDGTCVPVRYISFPMIENGKVVGAVITFSDITERIHIEAELAHHRHHLEEMVEKRTDQLKVALQAAEAANQAKSAFLANMSHEIRTPMNAILGFSHVLENSLTDPDELDKINKIKQSGKHLLGIINDILDLSKIDANHITPEKTPFQLIPLIEQVRGMMADRFASKQLMLVEEIDPGLSGLTLAGDPLRLRQILINYLGNAVKFTEHGSVTLRARVDDERDGLVTLCFEVQDTGIGISDAQQAIIFEPFEQADLSTTRKYGGSGLGLAIARNLARLMNGDAGVASVPGQGSTFWATVKLERSSAVAAQDRETGTPRDARMKRGALVLLVEDNEINQEVAREILEIRGLVVDVANHGGKAVEMVKAKAYDLILMDIRMPVMDGLAAARIIRGMPEGATIPILAMTANAFSEDRERCLAAGMNDFVAKPVEPERLYQTIARWVPEVGETNATKPEEYSKGTLAAAGHVLVNSEAGLKFVGGNLETYHRMLAKFVETHLADADHLQAALAAGDQTKAIRTAHTLKSTSATLGMESVRDVAFNLEHKIRDGLGISELLDDIARLHETLAAVGDEIKAMSGHPGAGVSGSFP